MMRVQVRRRRLLLSTTLANAAPVLNCKGNAMLCYGRQVQHCIKYNDRRTPIHKKRGITKSYARATDWESATGGEVSLEPGGQQK